MSILFITFAIGLFLVVVSIVGGGVEVKEIKIPNLGLIPRVLTFVLGSGLIAVALVRPDLLHTIEGTGDVAQDKRANALNPGILSAGMPQLPYVEPPYKLFYSSELGVTFEVPNSMLSVDTTEITQQRLVLRDGEGRSRIIITRFPLSSSKDVRVERSKEKEELESKGYKISYFAPVKEINWKNWYVLSGMNDNMIIYVRRWYLLDSVGSIEFRYPMEVKQVFETIVERMAAGDNLHRTHATGPIISKSSRGVSAQVEAGCPGYALRAGLKRGLDAAITA